MPVRSENKKLLVLKEWEAQIRYSYRLFYSRNTSIDFCKSGSSRLELPAVVAKLLVSRVVYEVFHSKGNGKYA